MTQPREPIDPHDFDPRFDVIVLDGRDDRRLSPSDHESIRLANEQARRRRRLSWSEAAMVGLGALCVLGMVWVVIRGW